MARKRKHARRNAVKWHRPRVRVAKGKFFHGPRSTLFGAGPVRLNRKHRRRHLARFLSNPIRVKYPRMRRHSRRHNPAFNLKQSFARITNRKWLTSIAMIGGGLVGGMVIKQLLVNLMAKSTITNKYTKYAGAGSILIGSLMVGMGKKRIIKEAGVVIAATGLYDLIASFVPTILPPLPGVTGPLAKLTMQGSYAVPYLPVSPVASMAGSYGSPVRAGYSLNGSYQAPEMATEGFHGDNNPYDGIDF